jgi:hypothetical protein
MSAITNNSTSFLYQSEFIKWDQVASVRTQPRRILLEEDYLNKVFWVPELAPISQHPLIIKKGLSSKILVHYLYLHLDFTIKLEQEAVNSVVNQIAQNKTGIAIPEEMRFDAYKIYCDEAYHALFYADFKRQVEAITGISNASPNHPIFLQRLREIQYCFTKPLSQLIEIFFVIVSETLISASLKKIPNDKRVVSTVRQLVRDHALDEAYHCTYFSNLLQVVWPQLQHKHQELIGQLLPQFIRIFLDPDYHALKFVLSQFDFNPQEIQIIVAESYPQTEVINAIKNASKNTITLFQLNRVLENPKIAKAFYNSDLC